MKNLCAILSLAAVYGLVRVTTASTLVSDVTFTLFLLGTGLVNLTLFRCQPALRKVAARKKKP